MPPLTTPFSAKVAFFVDFWVPAGSQNEPKSGSWLLARRPGSATFRRSVSKCLPMPLRTQNMTRNDRKSIENRWKNDRKSVEYQTKIERQSIAKFISMGPKCKEKCWRTLPKIKHKLRGDTLGKPIRMASHLGCGRSRASVFNDIIIECQQKV